MGEDKITLQAVRKSYKKSAMRAFPLTARLIGRPIADVLAVPLYNAGVRANGVTISRIILYFVSIFILSMPQYVYTILGALGLLTAFVLDFVDGHLARLHNEASFFGKFLDGFGDYLFPVFLTLPIAMRVDDVIGHFFFTSLSLFTAILILTNRMVRERFRYFLAILPKQFVKINGQKKALKRIQKFEYFCASHAANTRIFCIFILFVPEAEIIYLVTMLACQIVLELCWLCLIFLHSHMTLNHWRKSASAT